MNGKQHYEKAEKILGLAASYDPDLTSKKAKADIQNMLMEGQIHAILALTAMDYGAWTAEPGS